jgi:hypothetical protein
LLEKANHTLDPTEFTGIEARILNRIVVKAKKAMLDKQKQDETNYNLVCRKELTGFLKEKINEN